MEKVSAVMAALQKAGTAQNVKIYRRHGATGNLFGVSVANMKKIAKQIKGNHKLALELFDTGNADAMYLAGMVADGSKMTKTQLNKWAKNSIWYMAAEYAVPGVASESKHAQALANQWIKSKKDHVASCGWCTYVGVMATRDDSELDLKEIKAHLKQIEANIDDMGNRTRYTMNGFVIATGAHVKPLLKQAKAAAKKIGKVEVEMGETSCKVPLATDYIAKIEKMGRVGKKRKTIKC